MRGKEREGKANRENEKEGKPMYKMKRQEQNKAIKMNKHMMKEVILEEKLSILGNSKIF